MIPFCRAVFIRDDFFLQISMNARTQPCLTARNTARVSTLTATTRVTVTLGTHNKATCVMVGLRDNGEQSIE